MSLRTFTTLRDCDLKLWVDIIEQLTVKKFQPIALSQYCLFFILMYVEVPSFFQVTYNNLIINVLHIRYFPPEEEGSLMASRDWLYGACNAAGSSIPIYGLHIRLPPYQPV